MNGRILSNLLKGVSIVRTEYKCIGKKKGKKKKREKQKRGKGKERKLPPFNIPEAIFHPSPNRMLRR